MKKEQKELILKELESLDLLDYGKVIPREILESLLKIPYSDSWAFLGPFLEIKEFIEDNGFLCTTKNMEQGCLRIFGIQEMVPKSERIQEGFVRRMKRLQNSFANAKIQEFEEKDVKKHLHAANIITARLQSWTSVLSNI
jgi:tRNA 2-selenouridine synthase SelU